MNNPFESPEYTLERAHHLCREFEEHVTLFLRDKPIKEIVERDPKSNEQVYKVKLIKPMPYMLNGIAKDAATNLRSVLDQIGYAVSIAAGGKGKHTHFPFGNSATEVRSRIDPTRGKSREIPEEIFSLIESFKPYRGGDDLLWALNKLRNTNEHRIVSPTVLHSAGAFVRHLKVVNGSFKDPEWNAKKGEMEIARTNQNGYADYNIDFHMFITFTGVDVLYGQPADRILFSLLEKIENIMKTIKAEAYRIGLFK